MDHLAGGVQFQLYARPRKHRAVTLICYHAGSRRVQLTFRGGIEAARKHCKTLAQQVTSGEAIDALHLTSLDRRIYTVAKEVLAPLGRPVDAVAREFIEAHRILGGSGSLLDAVRAFRRHHASDLPSITLAHLKDELLLHLEKKRREPVTLQSIASILKPLAAAFPGVPLRTITTAELERYLSALQLEARTLNNHRAGIIRAFHYARGRYLPKDVPTAADAIEPISSGDQPGAVEIFKPWEFSTLLPALDMDLLPAVAIGGFAGLRTIELCRIEWSAVRFADGAKAYPHGYIEVQKGVAKRHRSAQRRIIPIQPNLAAWLDPHRFRQGPVSPYRAPSSLARAITTAIEKLNAARAKLHQPQISRPKNGCRHSYASYRLPELKNAPALAIEMNNSVKEINESYHELVAPGEVSKWWNIFPPAAITQLDFARL